MLPVARIKERLKAMMPVSRYLHSLGVVAVASDLAWRYGVDPVKAQLAGLVHDCARGLEGAVLLKRAGEFGILIDAVEERFPTLLHGPVGARIAEAEFGIQDTQVLEAVSLHTTGAARMSLLARIICLSDYIEPTRYFPGVERLRAMAAVDLNRALLQALDGTLQELIYRGAAIHPRAVQTRNWLLEVAGAGRQGRW